MACQVDERIAAGTVPRARTELRASQSGDRQETAMAELDRFSIPNPSDRDASIDLPPPFKRKRTGSVTDYANSSDPPLFSSDDLQPDGADYIKKRQKRLYPGTWWTLPPRQRQQVSCPPQSKRSFRRNFDSGVFMGSDASDIHTDDLNDLLQSSNSELRASNIGVAHGAYAKAMDTIASPADIPHDHPAAIVPSKELLEEQAKATHYVQRCIDREITLVDLSGRNLTFIRNETLEPLRYMLTVQKYQSFVPQIRLYLGQNSLTELPNELFNLANLTTLSVRSNDLVEIPSQIARLGKLRELNVTTNSLRYLPFSLLKLAANCLQYTETVEEFFTCQYRLRPNPFLEPMSAGPEAKIDCSPAELSNTLQVKAISAVSFFSIYGMPELYEQPAPSRTLSLRKPLSSVSSGRHAASSVPSLLELCLRSASSSNRAGTMLYEVEAFGAYAPISNTIVRGLEQAVKASEAGPLTCDVCEREYVVVRAEWLEWWAGIRDNEDDLIPLLRRTCSWACAKEADRVVDSVDESWRGCGWRPPT